MNSIPEKQERVYLLHFNQPLAHAKHYIGVASDLEVRLHQHGLASGAKLMQAVKRAGISWVLARVWIGDRELERALKLQHNTPRLCPICMQERLLARAFPMGIDLTPLFTRDHQGLFNDCEGW